MPSSGSTTIDRLVLRLYTIQSISQSPANTSSLVGPDIDIFPQEQNNPHQKNSFYPKFPKPFYQTLDWRLWKEKDRKAHPI